MKVLVYGLGRSGRAATKKLASQGHGVVTYDEKLTLEDEAFVKQLGGHITKTPLEETVHLCIAAPGVPFDHHHLLALREQGTETIGEVEWIYRSVAAPIIGVTGTAGKTSVTRWLTDTLQGSGVDAVAGGNIDPALSAVAEEGRTLVTELSSFQLERCPTLKPSIAIVLNLGIDHIDRHGSPEAYHAAKRAVTQNQGPEDLFIYNEDDSTLRTWAQASQARTQGFSAQQQSDAYLEHDQNDTWLRFQNERIIKTSDLNLRGKHQYMNALAVALAARELGLTLPQIRDGLQAFSGVPGRYAPVRTLGDVTFIEDSIATRGIAVHAALEATQAPIVWLGGGADKGATFEDLQKLINEKVSLFIGLGESGPSFAQAVKTMTKTDLCKQSSGEAALHCACMRGLEHLHKHHGGKGTILLAPLAASFDQFKDYKERAAIFKRIVGELATEDLWTSY